jgi:hypothetical protein
MFNISSETKTEAVEKMKEILGPDVPEDKLLEAFEAAVRVVARSFGM